MTYSVVEFQPNETIFRQGDPGDLMYLVQEGRSDEGGSSNR